MKIPERPHKRLNVWKLAMGLVARLYRVVQGFPQTEQFGLVSQMRRCSVSVPSNIAEGLARGTPREKVRFLLIAQGSLSELDTQVEIAHMVGYIPEETREELLLQIHQVQMLLIGLIRSIRNT